MHSLTFNNDTTRDESHKSNPSSIHKKKQLFKTHKLERNFILISIIVLVLFLISTFYSHYNLSSLPLHQQQQGHNHHVSHISASSTVMNVDTIQSIIQENHNIRTNKKIFKQSNDANNPNNIIHTDTSNNYLNNNETFLYEYVQSIRKPLYNPIQSYHKNEIPYDIYNCPLEPPINYPYEYPILDIIDNWNPNNTTTTTSKTTNTANTIKRPNIYQAICIFNYQTQYTIAQHYRELEKPFILRDDPQILKVVHRWNSNPNYLRNILGVNTKYITEYSTNNHLMFYRIGNGGNSLNFNADKYRKPKKGLLPENWTPPISKLSFTYDEFLEKANQPDEETEPNKPHYYFRVNAKDYNPTRRKGYFQKGGGEEGNFLFDELPFFQPDNPNFYIVDPDQTRGINCRFGMRGNIAETHYDGSRNFIILFGGERRYILSHPRNCKLLGLYPLGHPSARHSAIDWTDPKPFLEDYPEFQQALGNEVVLQAGDVLYLPTNWFHFIVSLELNWQCNARSGFTKHYMEEVQKCGFM